MEIFINAIGVFKLPQVIAGLLGGCIGAGLLAKAYLEVYSKGLCLLFGMLGVISAGAASEYALIHWEIVSIFLHTILGAISGIVGASGIDAVRLAAPKLMKDLVEGTSESIVTKVISLINWKK